MAIELILLMIGILLGIFCATVPYQINISNTERMNYGAVSPY